MGIGLERTVLELEMKGRSLTEVLDSEMVNKQTSDVILNKKPSGPVYLSCFDVVIAACFTLKDLNK